MKNSIFAQIKKENKYARIGSDGLLSDVQSYIDTGSYLFNALLSGSIYKGFPSNKIVGLAGPESCGKTYLALSILNNFLAESQNHYAIYYDTEMAIDTHTLLKIGIPLERFLHVPVQTLEDVRTGAVKVVETILESRENGESQDKYFFVIDSIGMPPTKAELETALKSDNKEDAGRRQKLMKSIFRCLTADLALVQCPMITTTHVYEAMQMYAQRGISGGKGMMYAGSIIVEFFVGKDKDSDGNVKGAVMTAKTRKSRLTKQGKAVKVNIDNILGLNKFYGLLDYAIEAGIVTKDGKKWKIGDCVVFKKEIEAEPEKYFTESVLKAIDEYTQKDFEYGQSVEPDGDLMLTEDELASMDAETDTITDVKTAVQ